MPRQRSLINRSEVRRRTLEIARETRAHPFTRVSADVFPGVENAVEVYLTSLVSRQPSVGRTIR